MKNITNNAMYIVQELLAIYNWSENSYTNSCKQTCG